MSIVLVSETAAAVAADSTSPFQSTITIPSTGAGNCLVLVVAQSAATTGTNISSISDNIGSTTYTFAASFTTATDGPPPVDLQSGANTAVTIAYALNIPAGITSITITWAAASKANALNVSEWSGVATASAVDTQKHGGGAVAATTQTATTLTTANANDVVVFAINAPTASSVLPALNAAGCTPTTGWNALTGKAESTTVAMGAAYQLASATGSYGASWTIGTSAKAGMVGLALQAAAGGTTYTDSGTGTVTLSGSGSESQSHSSSATGTVTFSGSGVENFQPPGGSPQVVGGYDQAPEFLLQRGPH